MTILKRSCILAIAMLLTAPACLKAQRWHNRQLYRKHPPKVILVKLSTYPSQVAYYSKTHQDEKLKNFERDVAKIRQNMVQDFNTGFRFRPVYYFYDSNAHYIMEGKFNGVLLDKDLQPASNTHLSQGDTNFLVVCNSVLMSEDYTRRNKKQEIFAATDPILVTRQRLIVLNHHFDQMPRGTVRVADGGVRGKSRRKYRYVSKAFNLSYYGKAATLSSNFEDFYGGSDFNK